MEIMKITIQGQVDDDIFFYHLILPPQVKDENIIFTH